LTVFFDTVYKEAWPHCGTIVMRTWTLLAACAALTIGTAPSSSARADGMGVKDDAKPRQAAARSAKVPARNTSSGPALPPPQPSVVVTVERGVRVWRPTGQVVEIAAPASPPQVVYAQPAAVAPYTYGAGGYGAIDIGGDGFGAHGNRFDKHGRRGSVPYYPSRSTQVTPAGHPMTPAYGHIGPTPMGFGRSHMNVVIHQGPALGKGMVRPTGQVAGYGGGPRHGVAPMAKAGLGHPMASGRGMGGGGHGMGGGHR
jgi:hypothetical protein